MPYRVLVMAAGLLALTACGSSPTTPPPPPAAPVVVCPAPVTIESPDNVPMPVTFTAPSATGGQAPVTVSCSAQSGSNFPLGLSMVTCTATDALQRQNSCSFSVNVTPTPRLAKTTFLAFGDSITAGVKSDPFVAQQARPFMRLFGLGPSHSYPYKLNDLLGSRYTRQLILVDNEGLGGELASVELTPDERSVGEIRIRPVLQMYNPQVLLLMEGTNDLYFGGDKAVIYAIPSLDRMIREAQDRGTEVFLATVPPQRPGRRPDRTNVAPLIPGFNEEVRQLALRRNVVLVDVYSALNANLDLYIGDDDLHPTEAGFQKIAETFFDAIRQRLDVTPPSSALSRR